jgi:hypothetical protein
VTAWISEYKQPFSGQRGPISLPMTPQIQASAGSTVAGAASTFALSTVTNLIRVACDQVCYLLFTSSTVATNATSTGTRVAANQVGEYFNVVPGSRLSVLST